MGTLKSDWLTFHSITQIKLFIKHLSKEKLDTLYISIQEIKKKGENHTRYNYFVGETVHPNAQESGIASKLDIKKYTAVEHVWEK